MPRNDLYHDCVKRALLKDGWKITHDPLFIKWRGAEYFPDLGAERMIGAERGAEKIAIEIKSFVGTSFQHELYEALGQYDSYSLALSEVDESRMVILAVSLDVFNVDFNKDYVKTIIQFKKIPILVYDIENETIENG